VPRRRQHQQIFDSRDPLDIARVDVVPDAIPGMQVTITRWDESEEHKRTRALIITRERNYFRSRFCVQDSLRDFLVSRPSTAVKQRSGALQAGPGWKRAPLIKICIPIRWRLFVLNSRETTHTGLRFPQEKFPAAEKYSRLQNELATRGSTATITRFRYDLRASAWM